MVGQWESSSRIRRAFVSKLHGDAFQSKPSAKFRSKASRWSARWPLHDLMFTYPVIPVSGIDCVVAWAPFGFDVAMA